jgi:hypothetical protein
VSKLTIELVPKTAHFQNARGVLTRAQWNHVKAMTCKVAAGACEICGVHGELESHEVWEWLEESATHGVQRLDRTIALCAWCHRVKHWGHTEGMGYLPQARRHVLRVNDWREEDLEDHVRVSWREWARLSTVTWQLDVSWLDGYLTIANSRRRRR